MVPYWGKRVASEHVGLRLVPVKCMKCGCEYFYELSRIGIGSRTAHYWIGKASAARSAHGQSQRDLARRLALEAELVPCPKCNWINDDLVYGFRLGRYRRFGMFAFGVGFIGTVGSLIGAWFISIGPAADRAALSYFLFGGPILFILLASGMILLRNWMRCRIQPNRDFPLPPKLPTGSPPALIWDEKSGELTPVNPGHPQDCITNDWHDFQIGRHELPLLCCDCLQVTDTEHGYKRQITPTMELVIPRCADCARIAKQRFRRIWWITVALGLLIMCIVMMPLRLESAEFWIIIGVSLLISFALASFVASIMTAPVKVAGGDGSRGVIRLRFNNADYGRIVGKHINDSSDTI